MTGGVRKKKPITIVIAMVLVASCDGWRCLWWPAKLQLALKKEKKIRSFDDCVIGTMICGHRLSRLLLFLEWPACSVFSGKAPAMVQFHFSAVFLTWLIVFGVFCL